MAFDCLSRSTGEGRGFRSCIASAYAEVYDFGEQQLLRWLGRNDLALVAHVAVIVLIGMNY